MKENETFTFHNLSKLKESEMGAYYPKIWKFLGFRKPREPVPEPPAIIREPSPEPEDFVPEPPKFKYPAPPAIIDVSVLASEVDSGRYPSIKRNVFTESEPEKDFHEDNCYICKDHRGFLYKCDFCHYVNHLECIRTRFIVKDPEPHDDFLCAKCIQGILTKRRRAEKRRLEGAVPDSSQEPLETSEIECLANRAQHVEEVLELIRDAQSRLQQLVEASRTNDFRRSLLATP